MYDVIIIGDGSDSFKKISSATETNVKDLNGFNLEFIDNYSDDLCDEYYLSKFKVAVVDYNLFQQVINKTRFLEIKLVLFNSPQKIMDDTILSHKEVRGLLFPTSNGEHIVNCIKQVACGGYWLPRYLMVSMLQNSEPSTKHNLNGFARLTRRELQILNCLVSGDSNQKIADKLFVSESTIKTHVYKLYRKLNVKSRKEAIFLFNQAIKADKADKRGVIDEARCHVS